MHHRLRQRSTGRPRGAGRSDRCTVIGPVLLGVSRPVRLGLIHRAQRGVAQVGHQPVHQLRRSTMSSIICSSPRRSAAAVPSVAPAARRPRAGRAGCRRAGRACASSRSLASRARRSAKRGAQPVEVRSALQRRIVGPGAARVAGLAAAGCPRPRRWPARHGERGGHGESLGSTGVSSSMSRLNRIWRKPYSSRAQPGIRGTRAIRPAAAPSSSPPAGTRPARGPACAARSRRASAAGWRAMRGSRAISPTLRARSRTQVAFRGGQRSGGGRRHRGSSRRTPSRTINAAVASAAPVRNTEPGETASHRKPASRPAGRSAIPTAGVVDAQGRAASLVRGAVRSPAPAPSRR